MRSSAIVILAAALGACTPVEDQWPSTEELERQWVPPASIELIPHGDAPPGASLADACAGAPTAPTAPLHAKLTLDLRRTGPETLEPGEYVELGARLRNRSLASSVPVVLSGDGSEVGWREPHVWYSGFVDRGDGCWRPISELPAARCGMFDHEWQDEIVSLSPGETVPLEWLGNPSTMLDMQQAGRVRLYLHYSWREGQTGKGGAPEGAVELGAMAGVLAFDLISNPIELTVERPLELRLRAKPRAPGAAVAEVADVVELHLHNVGDETREILPPSSGRLRFEVEGSEESWPSASWRAEDDEQPARPLPVGGELTLLGEGGLTPGLVYEWHHPVPELVRIRAAYRPYADRQSVELRSEWVEVDLRASP